MTLPKQFYIAAHTNAACFTVKSFVQLEEFEKYVVAFLWLVLCS